MPPERAYGVCWKRSQALPTPGAPQCPVAVVASCTEQCTQQHPSTSSYSDSLQDCSLDTAVSAVDVAQGLRQHTLFELWLAAAAVQGALLTLDCVVSACTVCSSGSHQAAQALMQALLPSSQGSGVYVTHMHTACVAFHQL
jgi:hypothetical protein